jgi:hypothetical protein
MYNEFKRASGSEIEITVSEQRSNQIFSEAIEDFLKAVYLLQQEQDRVQTSALAEALNITAPSTTEMAKKAGTRCTKKRNVWSTRFRTG